ncbi:MAG: ribosome maturation factor RimM [Desulfobulbaceae bacterium]|nr:ribosome maturation factor RimM [Desulfobulbaceae bacterium]
MVANGPEELVLVGKVSKAHGIRGEIKVYPYSGNPEQFAAAYHSILLSSDAESVPVACVVEKARVQGKQVLLKLENCSDRTAAELLVGQLVYVPEEDLPELAEDEFYLQELQGKEVVDISGNLLGRSSHIIDTGAQDLLVILRAGKEYLIPVVGDFIVAIEEERVVLDLPPGLMEING